MAFDKDLLRSVQAAMLRALEPVAKAHGIAVASAGGTFGADEATLKFRLLLGSTDSAKAIEDRERREWNLLCGAFGFTPDQYRAEFTLAGRKYRLRGFRPRASAMPIRAERDDGKLFKFGRDIVKSMLGVAR